MASSQASRSGFDRGVLLLDDLGQNSQRCQIVLDLLKGRQNRLPIIRDGLIVVGPVLLDRSSAQSRIENCFRKAWSHGPKAAWPSEPVRDAKSFRIHQRRSENIGIICGLGHADLGIGLGHTALSRRNVRTPLQ